MLFLLSPAKSLNFERPVPPELEAALTRPQFVAEAAELVEIMRGKSLAEVQALMDLSEPLAALNVERYAAWRPRFTPGNSKPAVLAFDGDVYGGLDAASLAPEELLWAQQHLRLLSGLYGLLRPLDRMQAYRLEMGVALANPAGGNLYAYWGERISATLNRLAREQAVPVVVNLASQEYFRAVNRKLLKPRVLDCQFEDEKNGQFKIISFFAKRARGLMARWCIQQRVQLPEDLREFAVDGYRLAPEVSTPEKLVFRRAA